MDFDLKILNEFFSTETTEIINKHPFLEKFFTTILSTEKYRWDGYQTTSGKYSYLVNHLIGVAKIAKIINLPEKYIFAAFLHDICEIPFGDVSVGLRNTLIKKLKELKYEANDAKLIVKYFKELQDQQGFSIEIEKFLASFDVAEIKDEKTKLIIQKILSGFLLEENPIIQFLEKIETNCLFLRENITDFIKEVFEKTPFININYSLQFLPKLLNKCEFDKEIKLNCIKLQIAFIAEFLSKCENIFTIKPENLEKFNKLKEIIIDIKENGLKQENFNTLLNILGYNPSQIKTEIIIETIPYIECKAIFTEVQRASDCAYNLELTRYRPEIETFTEPPRGVFYVFERKVLKEQKQGDPKHSRHEALYRLVSEQAATKGKFRMHPFSRDCQS